MATKIPQTMTGSSVFIEGVGFLGTSKEIELPKIEFETWESKAGLMVRKIDSGILKAMTTKIVMEQYNDVYFSALGKRWKNNVGIYAKQNIAPNNIPIVATFRGSISSMQMPKMELAKEVNITIELNTWFYKFEIEGNEKLLIDLENMILQIDGEDKYADIRANVL
jgi:P2 family phage contractile tail tube protein